jgi:23S rRNA (cytidine1920-2'-O)/16S rRNA (cytidine1409-2'-O)-methyltransferase
MRASRIRLDVLLVVRGLVQTQAHAQAAILAGEVYVDQRRIEKPGTLVPEGSTVELRSRQAAYASRGGIKLEHALRTFALEVAGAVGMDVGASTGGFTDCLLQHGARKVFAVDVGRGQLSWKLRHDPRVISLERHDVRNVTLEDLGEQVDLATVDVSFISLVTVLPAIAPLVKAHSPLIVLLKPQFESGPDVAKGGVVRDPDDHRRILTQTMARIEALGLSARDLTASPLVGPEGNIEFFLQLENGPGRRTLHDVDQVVIAAHARIRKGSQHVGIAAQRT